MMWVKKKIVLKDKSYLSYTINAKKINPDEINSGETNPENSYKIK